MVLLQYICSRVWLHHFEELQERTGVPLVCLGATPSDAQCPHPTSICIRKKRLVLDVSVYVWKGKTISVNFVCFQDFKTVRGQVSILLRYNVEVVTSNTMQNEMTQSVRFSIGTYQAGLLRASLVFQNEENCSMYLRVSATLLMKTKLYYACVYCSKYKHVFKECKQKYSIYVWFGFAR